MARRRFGQRGALPRRLTPPPPCPNLPSVLQIFPSVPQTRRHQSPSDRHLLSFGAKHRPACPSLPMPLRQGPAARSLNPRRCRVDVDLFGGLPKSSVRSLTDAQIRNKTYRFGEFFVRFGKFAALTRWTRRGVFSGVDIGGGQGHEEYTALILM